MPELIDTAWSSSLTWGAKLFPLTVCASWLTAGTPQLWRVRGGVVHQVKVRVSRPGGSDPFTVWDAGILLESDGGYLVLASQLCESLRRSGALIGSLLRVG